MVIFTRKLRRMWPLQMTVLAPPKDITTARFMHRTRKLLDIRHIWERLDIQWDLLQRRLPTLIPPALFGMSSTTGCFSTNTREAWNGKKTSTVGGDAWAVWNRCGNTPKNFFDQYKVDYSSIRWLFALLLWIRASLSTIWRTEQVDMDYNHGTYAPWDKRKGTDHKKHLPDIRDVPMQAWPGGSLHRAFYITNTSWLAANPGEFYFDSRAGERPTSLRSPHESLCA